MNKDSTAFSVFMLYFPEIIHLLVEGTDHYYNQYLDKTFMMDFLKSLTSPIPRQLVSRDHCSNGI
jgi:hypothetical protein